MNQARELPKIDIGGTQFYLDIRLNEFRQVTNFANRIDLDALWEDGEGYQLCFDPLTRNIFNGTEEEYHTRKDLQVVKLPGLEIMDPIGFGRIVEQWKDKLRALPGFNEEPPVVKSQETECAEDLLPKKRNHNSKGIHL